MIGVDHLKFTTLTTSFFPLVSLNIYSDLLIEITREFKSLGSKSTDVLGYLKDTNAAKHSVNSDTNYAVIYLQGAFQDLCIILCL